MKIALTTFAATPDDQVSTRALAHALVDHGHTVSLIADQPATNDHPPPARPADSADPAFLTALLSQRTQPTSPDPGVGKPLDQLTDYIHGLPRQLDDGFDVVHSTGWLAGLSTQLAVRGLHEHNRQRLPKVIHTVDRPLLSGCYARASSETEIDTVRRRLHTARLVSRTADRVIVSHSTHRTSLVRAGVRRGRISVIPPGVDPTLVPAADSCRVRSSAPYRLLLVGVPRRGHPSLIELARALTRLPEAELTVCELAEEPLGPDAAALAGLLGPSRLGRPRDTAERHGLVSSVDLVISAEQAGTVHLEAMNASIPVIALSHLVAEAVVEDITWVHAVGVRGKLLQITVRELLRRPNARHGMALAGRDRAMHRYAWDRVAAETIRVYEHAASRPTAP